MNFTQSAGLKKTYAHRWLFDINSPTLNAIIDEIIPADNNGAIRILFKNMFVELNKKHVNAGIAEFAPNLFSAKIEKILGSWSQDTYGITSAQYNEMRTFCKPLYGVFVGDTYAKEIYENKFLLDAIHEAVILYFPTNYVSVSLSVDDRKLIESARTDLQQSLTGYFKDRKRHINLPDKIPNDIAALTTAIAGIKHKFDSLPNVVHLEAVAELYRHSFLTVDKKDALSVIAHAHVSSPPLIQRMIDYLKDYLKSLYKNAVIQHIQDYLFNVGNDMYLVWVNNNKSFESEKFKPSDVSNTSATVFTFNLDEARTGPVKYIDDLVKKFNAYTNYRNLDGTPIILEKINETYSVYQAIGDGNCLYHAVLNLSETYQNIMERKHKIMIGYMFRVYIAMYVYDECLKIDDDPRIPLFVQKSDDKKNIGWPAWTDENRDPTFKEAINLNPKTYSDQIEVDINLLIEIMFNINLIIISKEIDASWGDFNDKIRYAIIFNEHYNKDIPSILLNHSIAHYDTIIKKGALLLEPNFSGGSNKKAKTRKSRIFKKWESRRRRM